jgi:hypothetical protein
MMGAHPISRCWDIHKYSVNTLSESPAKGGQIVVHPAAAARTIVAVTFPPVFMIFVCAVVCVGSSCC